jgi:hypothetical protein
MNIEKKRVAELNGPIMGPLFMSVASNRYTFLYFSFKQNYLFNPLIICISILKMSGYFWEMILNESMTLLGIKSTSNPSFLVKINEVLFFTHTHKRRKLLISKNSEQ